MTNTILTALYVILTAFYVYFTKKILESNRKTLETVVEQTWHSIRAIVLVQATFRDKYVFALRISNQGKSTANNVEFRLDRNLPFMFDTKEKVNDFFLFSQKIPTIPPGAVYHVDLWPGHAAPGEGCPEEFCVTARYETVGRSVEEQTTVSVKMWQGQNYPPRQIEESLEHLDERLKEIVGFLNAVKFKLAQFLESQTWEYSKRIRESRQELIFDPFEKPQEIKNEGNSVDSQGAEKNTETP